ncbi:uncharacterized protein BX663DRAFT_353029 [Cokeromyces recurvatus]|uniref:uncharacterized protein n=1 Tax=Cokeromyces recurvatus TaxID=90255 RepID=UPI00222012EB|nr:uncharacterized protein BX663DRAFT_353029 [Cokeromyces recurvatus]KAI7904025.1 hypothetical protein BX663DRAFT_353029 [Cokeromyces recurvatus]
MTEQRKKKAIKYHFIDMNDPNRYKKLKVTRACDFCRKRKSKCDLGIPGSGTCSNCKKAKNMCVFSSIPTSTKSNSNSFTNLKSKTSSSTSILQLNGNASIITENDFSDLFQYSSTNIQYDFSNLYQTQNPLFSLDCKGRCNYEKHSSNTYIHSHVSSLDHITSTIDEIPSYSKQTEYELFHTFFNYVHPFYPILDSFQILQSLQCDSKPIPNALKWAIMAIALHFTQHYQKGSSATLATIYYHQAYLLLDHSSPSLSSLQTLLLLYKFEELMTPVGASLSTVALSYLYKALDMLKNLLQEQTGLTDMWTIKDEFICRNGWILFIIITTSSNADERWRELLEDCPTPSRLPSLIEREHYNKGEFDTACNLIHLINITLLYSRVIRFIFDQSTLFAKDTANYLLEFNKFATSLDVWRASASKHLSLSLVDNPSMPYSAQVHSNTNNDGILHHSISKTAFFTAYLCLIHDILDVLISIHCATSNSYLFDDLPRKITQPLSKVAD